MISATINYRQNEIGQLHNQVFGVQQEDKDVNPQAQVCGDEYDQGILERAFKSKSGDKIRRLYNGDISDYPSHSEADQALCNYLAFWFNRDAAKIDYVFKQSGLYREKWDEKHYSNGQTYGERTIQNAIDQCSATYGDKKAAPDKKKLKQIREEFSEKIKNADDFEYLTQTLASEVQASDLSEAAKHALLKAIARKAGVPLATIIHREGNDEITHEEIAKEVIGEYGCENILSVKGDSVWVWRDSGVWKQIDDREVKIKIHKAMGEMGIGHKMSKNSVNSVLDLLKTDIFRPEHRFDVVRESINCLNGELHYRDAGWVLKPHCRENYRTTQIPVKYDPDANAPRFSQFLEEIFEEDPDKEDKIDLVSECIGYSLVANSMYEKFIILAGSGANGKSVLLSTVKSLMGRENIAGVQPNQLDNKFQRAHLRGKLANIITEMPEGHVIADAQLKAIVSGELLTAEHKHKPPFDFEPFCTCWFGTNHMPKTRDFSDALFRRAIVVPFNRIFTEKDQDRNLTKKLENELPGILNIALEAIAGVFERGEFTRASSCEEAAKDWQFQSDQVAMFAEEMCEFEANSSISSGELYEAYKKWADRVGINVKVEHRTFTMRMKRLGAIPHKGGGGARLLKGVRLLESGNSGT